MADTLDLGALFATADIITAPFDAKYSALLAKMQQLGVKVATTGESFVALDDGLASTGASASKAAAGIDRATAAVTKEAQAATKAAAITVDHAEALARVDGIMSRVTVDAQRMQQAELRLVAAQERLNAVLGSGTATTQQLASAQAGLIGAQRSLDRAQEQSAGRMSTLTGSMDAQAASLARVEAVMARYASAAPAVQQAALKEAAAQERLTEVQASGVATTRELAAAQGSLIGAQRSLVAAQTATAASSEKATGAFAGTLKMAGQLGLMFGAFEAVKKTIEIAKEAANFQQSMLMIQTNAGASADEVKRMSAAVLGMAGPLATAPDKLADALYHVEQNGLRGQKALDALRVGAMGAKVGMADVEDTTNTMTIAMASGIHGVQNLQQAMGFMIATVGTGDMRLKDLNEALSGGILSVAKGFGASLRDVAAVLATLGDNGIRGADAATALRQTLMGFAAPAKGGAAALKAVGLGMSDLRDELEKHGLVAAMNDLEQHMTAAGITGSKVGGFITEAFGRKAGAGIAVLMGEIDRLNIKYIEAQKGAQTFGDRWNATTQTAKFKFQQLGASVQAEGVRMASAALPVVTIIGSQLGGALHDIVHIIGAVGSAASPVFAAIGGAVVGAAYALHGITSVLSDLVPVLKVVAITWGTMWAAQTGARLAASAIAAVSTAVEAVPAKFAAAQASVMGFWTNSAAAGAVGAAATVDEAALMAGAADTAAAEIDAAGASAEAGWVGLAGPIGLAAGALIAVVSLFHSSDDASKAATESAKKYADTISSAGDLTATVAKALTDDDLPSTLDQLNKALGKSKFSSAQFVTAIQSGGKPLAALSKQLDQIAKDSGPFSKKFVLATAAALTLKNEADGVSNAVKGQIATFKQLGLIATPIAQVGQKLGISADAAKQYAGMLGLAVTKEGNLVDATAGNIQHLAMLKNAYDSASTAVAGLLDADKTFAGSQQTAADRAALIGATLKANAGDALDYASSMNGAATAVQQMGSDIASAAKSVGKNGVSTRDFLRSIINLKHGSIDYSKAAAAPLISSLESVQSAALASAQASYQHNRALLGGKAAADSAVNQYEGVKNGLVDQLVASGLAKNAAQRLADRYLGMPKNVRTAIETEGHDKVVDILNRIGAMLAKLTGQTWNTKVAAQTNGAVAAINNVKTALAGLRDKSLTINEYINKVDPNAAAEAKRDRGRTVGSAMGNIFRPYANGGVEDHYPQIATARANMVRVWAEPETGGEAYIPLANDHRRPRARQIAMETVHRLGGIAAFAMGGSTPGVTHVGKDWIYDGTKYASQRAAENAQQRASTKAGKTRQSGLNAARDDFGHLGKDETSGDLSSVRSRLSAIAEDLKKAGVPASFIHGLHADNVAIVNATSARTKAADALAKANAALADAKKVMADDAASFKGAVTGSFDITSAGASPVNGAISGGTILAQSAQAVTRAKAFVTGLQRLIGLKLFPETYIRELAAKGPDALPEIQALNSLSSAQMRTLAVQNAQLYGLGSQIGGIASQRLDGALVAKDQGAVARAQATEKAAEVRVQAANARLAADIGKKVGVELGEQLRGLELRADISNKQLAVIVQSGLNALKNTRGHLG